MILIPHEHRMGIWDSIKAAGLDTPCFRNGLNSMSSQAHSLSA